MNSNENSPHCLLWEGREKYCTKLFEIIFVIYIFSISNLNFPTSTTKACDDLVAASTTANACSASRSYGEKCDEWYEKIHLIFGRFSSQCKPCSLETTFMRKTTSTDYVCCSSVRVYVCPIWQLALWATRAPLNSFFS